ncbi:MAG: complex I NDUFA9 subunit family protein [Dehalococcoidia bacterium]
MATVLVTGATGFVGRHVVPALASAGWNVRALAHRGRERVLGAQAVDIRHGDVTDAASLRDAVSGVDAVVHLVAVIRERRESTFRGINHLGTKRVVEAATDVGVQHFLQMSAIGARDDPAYPYLCTKWQGEQEVIRSGLPYTILRPSIQFGEGDEFFNMLAGVVRAFPVVPVPGSGRTRYQPIAVEDVARCVALALGNEAHQGKTLELGGSQQYTYNHLLNLIAKTLQLKRVKMHIPVPLMRLIVWLLELVLPRPPVTTQQLKMLPLHNIAQGPSVEELFGFQPRPLEGNINYIRRITFGDALRISLGSLPTHIRDH